MKHVDWRPSPNIEPRRAGARLDMLILHYTGMMSAERACDWLCDPASRVSCHYLIDEQGGIVRMVEEKMRAWHAGTSSWKSETDTNSRSIGIEIHNPGHAFGYPAFPRAQMEAVVALCLDILSRRGIAPQMVLGHSDVAPRRKIDPGEKFDWELLHRAGVGHWVPPAPLQEGRSLRRGDKGAAVAALQRMLARYGYGIGEAAVFDEATAAAVTAFQRHFRPERVDGIADRSTVATLRRLIAAAPQPAA